MEMKKELALRIVQLNILIAEQENDLKNAKEAIQGLKERREAFLKELVDLVNNDN